MATSSIPTRSLHRHLDLQPAKSSTNFPTPQSWVQHVQSDAHELSLHEEIVTANGEHMTVTLRAAFDGKDYPVAGSHYVDTMAYTRLGPRSHSGVGKQKGAVTLRDTITVAPAGNSLNILLSIFTSSREIATGTLVFDKS